MLRPRRRLRSRPARPPKVDRRDRAFLLAFPAPSLRLLSGVDFGLPAFGRLLPFLDWKALDHAASERGQLITERVQVCFILVISVVN